MDLRNAKKLVPGKALGAQPGFADAFNQVLDILNGLDGDPAAPGIVVNRGPARWTLGLRAGKPAGVTLLGQYLPVSVAVQKHPTYDYWCLRTDRALVDIEGGLITRWETASVPPLYDRIWVNQNNIVQE